jgi:hypothetical protein
MTEALGPAISSEELEAITKTANLFEDDASLQVTISSISIAAKFFITEYLGLIFSS